MITNNLESIIEGKKIIGKYPKTHMGSISDDKIVILDSFQKDTGLDFIEVLRDILIYAEPKKYIIHISTDRLILLIDIYKSLMDIKPHNTVGVYNDIADYFIKLGIVVQLDSILKIVLKFIASGHHSDSILIDSLYNLRTKEFIEIVAMESYYLEILNSRLLKINME